MGLRRDDIKLCVGNCHRCRFTCFSKNGRYQKACFEFLAKNDNCLNFLQFACWKSAFAHFRNKCNKCTFSTNWGAPRPPVPMFLTKYHLQTFWYDLQGKLVPAYTTSKVTSRHDSRHSWLSPDWICQPGAEISAVVLRYFSSNLTRRYGADLKHHTSHIITHLPLRGGFSSLLSLFQRVWPDQICQAGLE